MKKSACIAWVLFGLVYLSAPAAAALRAVICGVSDYKNINDIKYADNDAQDVYQCLKDYTNPVKMKLLLDAQATFGGIKDALIWMRDKAKPGDVCIFYFAGHGTWGPDVFPFDETDGRDEYICPYNAYGGSLKKHIRDDKLALWLAPLVLKGAYPVVILDACFSGGAIRKRVEWLGEEKEVLARTQEGVPYGEIIDGFARDLYQLGFSGMAACGESESSYEWPWFQHGLFTWHLLVAASGQADGSGLPGGSGNDDLVISFWEWFDGLMAIDDLFYDYLGPGQVQAPQAFCPVTDLDILNME